MPTENMTQVGVRLTDDLYEAAKTVAENFGDSIAGTMRGTLPRDLEEAQALYGFRVLDSYRNGSPPATYGETVRRLIAIGLLSELRTAGIHPDQLALISPSDPRAVAMLWNAFCDATRHRAGLDGGHADFRFEARGDLKVVVHHGDRWIGERIPVPS